MYLSNPHSQDVTQGQFFKKLSKDKEYSLSYYLPII